VGTGREAPGVGLVSFPKLQRAGFEYNSLGKVTRSTDPSGRATSFNYAANGIDLLEVRHVNGQSTDLLLSDTYNAQHEPLTVTDASGQTWTNTYNAQGQLLTTTSPARAGITENRTTTYSYDTNGYLQSITGPATGATTSFTYDGYGRVRTVTDPDSYVLTYDYDALDRQTKVTYPDGSYEQTVYNRLDVEQQRDRLGRWTHTFYDALRRAVAIRDSLGQTATLQWCNCGSLEKVIDPNGNATSWERDVQGRVTRTIRPDGTDATLTYETTTSRPQQFRDPKQQLATIQYFADNNWKQATFSNTTQPTPAVSFTYDSVYNRLATMTDGTGMTSYSYYPVTSSPALGAVRLQTVDGPLGNDTITYTYDELGRVASRSINEVALSQDYDALGRLTGETNALGAFTYGYEGVTDRLASLAYPNGQTTALSYFGNTQDHRLQDLHNKLSGGATLSRFQYVYAADGAITSWTQQTDSNPAKAYDLGHDAVNQLTAATLRTTEPTPLVLKRYSYSYDKTVNRMGEQIDDASTSASINTLNAVTALQPGGALRFAGTMNEAATVTVQGKPAQVTTSNQFSGSASVSSGTSTVAVNATDPSGNTRTNTYQVTESGATKTLTYDANGSLTSDGTRTFEWDGANRLTAVNQGTHRSEFTYDGWSHRVRIVEKDSSVVTSDRRFLWCGTSICEERDSSGSTVTRRFFDQGMQESGTAYFYTGDHLGSIRELTDTIGTIHARYDYDPYGRATKISGDKDSIFTFTGYFPHNPSGLLLAPLRAYDPSFGRWISQDPIGLRGGMNAYSYVDGMPVDARDPLGLFAGPAAGAATVAAGGGSTITAAGLAAAAGTVAAVAGAAVGGWMIGSWIDQHIINPPTDPQDGGTGTGTGTGTTTSSSSGSTPSPPPALPPSTIPPGPSPRKDQDPVAYPPQKQVNPGRDCNNNNNCKPCPPNVYWQQQGPPGAHGSASGLHWHGIVWEQNPVTCVCTWKRKSFGQQPY
jgi:RHS repeat-associated protein